MNRADGATVASPAERFQDEKRRIIESCFNKKDPDGSIQETYITHIRVTEYSSHASSPPPPQARTPEFEKPRLIIIAVRKSGRVRMHKAKENANLTFSIGKTWNLDDLTLIESYTSPQCNPNFREWAGDTGFTATLGKPYYWRAQTDKEKKFFIANMIKIYGKYTGGKLPELRGFDQKELDQVLGAVRRPAGAPQGPLPPRPPMPGHPPSQQTSLLATSGGLAVHSDPSRPHRAPPIRQPPSSNPSPVGSFDSTVSRDKLALRKAVQNNKSQESFAAKSDDASSLPRSRNGSQGPGSYGRFGEQYRRTPEPAESPLQPLPQPSFQSNSRPITPVTPKEDRPPPERRRPPMEPLLPHDRALVPPPLKSPGMKREASPQAPQRDAPREPVAPPPRSAERMSPPKSAGSDQIPPASLTASVQAQTSPPSMPLKAGSPEPTKPESPPPKPIYSVKSPSSNSLPKDVEPAPPTVAETPAEAPAEKPSHLIKGVVVPVPEIPEEESRPGLGPMIKSKKSKGDIAGAIWKAASAVGAFKPRPGGAGERLRQMVQQKPEGPDGITSVVPAPPRPPTRDNAGAEIEPAAIPERKPDHKPNRASLVPDVKISVPDSSRSRPSSSQGAPVEVSKAEVTKPAEPTTLRKSAAPAQDAKYLQTLGVDPAVLDGRSDEFGMWLDYFGWVPGEQMRNRNIDDMRADLDRELNKAQAGGWLARFKEDDERVDAIKKGIDVAMAECDEMDNLLTLYCVELSTLSEDIAYIEAQGQGLQVQTANQKLLKKELESLLETCAITSTDLEVLRTARLDNLSGLEDAEKSLVTLFKAMIKMDPTLGGRGPKAADATVDSDQILSLNSDYGQMRIVQEKKEMYLRQSADFMQRLVAFMGRQFDEAFAETKRALEGALAKKADSNNHDVGRDMLWKYSPLMLYSRDADLDNWNILIQLYQEKSHPLYKGEFQSAVAVWRKNARKLTGEEADLLFSSHIEKHQEGVAQTARKLTVKRSQTLARALRSPLADGERKSSVDKSGADRRSLPYVVFAGVLEDLLPLVEMEQNFIIDFFHATTLEQIDFPDAVAAFRPGERRGGDLKRHRLMEPDRDLARRVTRSMEVIFAFFEAELQRLMEWAIGQDPLQGVGVLATMEKHLATIGQSNQDYLNITLHKLHALLGGRFRKFVDEQVRAIEDTKVKISKRKGVISFIRVFPAFSNAVENMLVGVDANFPIRRTVNGEYDRILRSMFDSLKVIAREHPAVGASQSNADPEDKEALNFHILLIENANHFVEETDTRGLEVLEVWKENASAEYHEHMELYLNAAMRRPLGKLLDYLESIEAQLQSGKGPSAIAAQPSNSKTIFNKILGAYDAKEVRKGIEALRKRVEKHFGDADDEALSKGLVAKVLRECEAFYGTVEGRIGRITTDVYGGDVLFEWPRTEVKAAFR